MRILFLCSSLEPGRDGVGDYSRRLAVACRDLGHEVALIAPDDRWLPPGQTWIQSEPLLTHRSRPASRHGPADAGARHWISRFKPDWISMQFVPYGWHSRGMVFGLGRRLAALTGGAPVHLMFHELWVGISRQDRWQNKIQGPLQRLAVRSLVRRLAPSACQTAVPAYRQELARSGIASTLLPLFGNIPVEPGEGEEARFLPRPEPVGSESAGPKPLSLGIFGTVHPEWDGMEALARVHQAARLARRAPALTFLGRIGPAGERLVAAVRRRWPELPVQVAGELAPDRVSRLLRTWEVGLSSTPWALAGKSGTAASLRDHGVPVLFTRTDWVSRWGSSPQLGEQTVPKYWLAPAGRAVPLTDMLAARCEAAESLPGIAHQFVRTLHARAAGQVAPAAWDSDRADGAETA